MSFVVTQAIERQAAAGVAEADSLILVVDGQSGLSAADEEIVAWLRRSQPGKPLLLAVNKCENAQKADLQVGKLLPVFWKSTAEAQSFRAEMPFRHSAVTTCCLSEALHCCAGLLYGNPVRDPSGVTAAWLACYH